MTDNERSALIELIKAAPKDIPKWYRDALPSKCRESAPEEPAFPKGASKFFKPSINGYTLGDSPRIKQWKWWVPKKSIPDHIMDGVEQYKSDWLKWSLDYLEWSRESDLVKPEELERAMAEWPIYWAKQVLDRLK